MDWQTLETRISEQLGEQFVITGKQSVGGGCINEAWRIDGPGKSFFIKLNQPELLDMFEAEFAGLQEMFQSGTIRVPQPLLVDRVGHRACVVMEYISLGGRGRSKQMGEQLAAMHKVSRDRFGWIRDNTIGSTPQINKQESDWLVFWREHRLRYQLDLAARRGIGHNALRLGEQLMDQLERFFEGYQPQASLLHGDLWGGNAGFDDEGNPVIFDPACYYGDRETDLAMTELFGGFGGDFRQGYESVWPLDSGYAQRKTLYNLYHILNHFNLFGGGYGRQAEGMMQQLLR